jgi:parallel beta-helix repeat protein
MATFTVTTASDENDGGTGGSGLSLREALTLANSSSGADTINFAQSLSGQTISLTLGELVITDSLTLTGLGANNLSVSGNNLSRVFNVNDGSFSSTLAVSLSGITLTAGNSAGDGGGIFNQENLSLSDTIVTGNSAAGNGGGLFNGIGTVTLSNSSLSNNRASQDGGGLFNEGTLNASNSSFSNNAASSRGGAIANSGGTATVSGSGFTGNVASQSGGGFFNNGTATVSGSSFSNNSAVNHGGGLLTVAGGTSTIEQSNFSGNSAGGNGGGLSSNLSTTSVSNSNLSGNRAGGDGGGIYSDLSTTNVSNSNLSTNSALNNGGGIASTNSSSTTLSSSSLTQNTAGNNGGGLSNSDGSFARLNNSTLNGNSAGVNGGGLANESGGTAIVSQNTLSGNNATNSGGGIYSQDSTTTTTLSNSTVTLNWAASGGGLFNDLGSTTLTSTIVGGNTNKQDLGGSSFSSGGNNLIGNGSGASGFTNGVNSDLVGTAATPIDPLLGSLQNNGGSTLTHALLAGSPAINAGSNPDNLQNDQRGSGFPRTLDGATDIGAIEQKLVPVPGIRLEQAVNAADPNNPTAEEDADLPPGRALPVGTNVTWTYQVFNEGNVPLTVTSITDDFGTPNNPADDFTPAPVLSNGFNVGDSNKNNRLDPTEVWRYTSAGVVSYQVQGSTGGGGVTLGEAATFGILGLNGGTVSINSATKIVGDVGYSKGVTSTINQKAEDFQGTALVHSQVASFAYTDKNYKPTGGIVRGGAADARLDRANADALVTSAQIAAMTANVNLGSINDSSRSVGAIDGVATTTVVAINSLNMNSDVLEFKGDAQDYFLINVAGNFDFSQSEVRLTGGITANHILFNFANASTVVLNKDKNIWNGTILAPTGSVEYHNPATFNGAIVAKNITLHSYFNLTHKPFAALPQNGTQPSFYTNIAKVTAQDPNTGVVVTDTDSSSFFGINGQSIQGTSQNNTLVGTSNNDYIVGGAGPDILTGNGGNDIFGYQALSDAGDTITDFASGDFISVFPLLKSVGYMGSDPFADGYLKVYQQGNNTVISFDADGNSGAASPVTLVTLENFQGSLSYDSTRGLLGVVLPDVMPVI